MLGAEPLPPFRDEAIEGKAFGHARDNIMALCADVDQGELVVNTCNNPFNLARNYVKLGGRNTEQVMAVLRKYNARCKRIVEADSNTGPTLAEILDGDADLGDVFASKWLPERTLKKMQAA